MVGKMGAANGKQEAGSAKTESSGRELQPADRMSSRDLEPLLGRLTPGVARPIDRALSGEDLSIDDAVTLFDCTGADMQALVYAADALRRGEQRLASGLHCRRLIDDQDRRRDGRGRQQRLRRRDVVNDGNGQQARAEHTRQRALGLAIRMHHEDAAAVRPVSAELARAG